MSTKRLLGVFAHPDDEGIISGALQQYHAHGAETGLVYATRGEVGEISDSSLATPENLGEVREREVRTAAAILHVPHLWFLGYRDSGPHGSADNQDPQAFIHARAAKVIGQLVAIIREFRPQVIVTFDETGGGNEHPDHIAIYKYVTGAFHSAADELQYPEAGPAYAVSKLYYSSFARRQLVTMAEWLEGQGYEGFIKDLEIEKLGFTDDQFNNVLDVERWQNGKAKAWEAHRTQLTSNTLLTLLPYELRRKLWSTEYFQLVASRVGYDVIGENNLFARVP
ncbi:PIG-L deacetylase family protein [Tengunoibacter tsumagoiensis]|uniref:Mycothiol S-conjugate amidase n=1 Tax=Tengunoibacter tsumagoiensis TaxID=2014871 RepID=A0A402A5I0_9CHLR|nr:PIG-L family deacetylase [Tengunoibacter tsumagoiensis]GCE14275.1 mycothiol S-conjugate amidase [Tengunoibacter tsumagoiensis]